MKFLICFAILLACLSNRSASAAPPAGYYEVWGDEFNGTSLDPTKWWVWDQPDRSGYTTPDAVTEGGGYLTLHTYTTNGNNYSPIISSDARFRIRYGYLESSVEFNGSPGMFSDFWIQSPNNGALIGDPAAEGAELDVCEHRATDANNADDLSGMVTIDLHWNGYTAGIEKTATSGLVGAGLGTGFHTYGLLWNSTNYTVSIDGTPMWNTNVGVAQRTEIVLLSSEVDSNSFCGIVPPAGYGNFLVSTTSTVVDYVRFYAPTTTLYWIGASSANFSDTNNWLSNMVPTSATDAVFSYLSLGNYNVNLAQNTTVNSLSIEESGPITISGSALTVNSGGIDLLSALYGVNINSAVVLGGAQSWNAAPGIPLVVYGAVSGTGNLTVNGPGIIALESTNNYNGTTTVKNGALQVDGSLANPITVSGGTLDGAGSVAGPVTLASGTINGPATIAGLVTVNGGTLSGTESILGAVVVNNGGTLSPGSPMGALVISNSLTLEPGSVTVINLNESTKSTSQITGLTGITFGGTLVISNQSGSFAAGDTFNIFQAGSYAGAFTRISPASPGPGLFWDTTSLNTQGLLQVITTNSASLTAQMAGQQLSLSWPSDHVGWLLQSQTNMSGGGITDNWVTMAGSTATNLMSFTMNPAAASVYFRLAEPSFSTNFFGSGDLIVLQVGNGSINAFGAPGVLNDYLTLGGAVQVQVALPTTGGNALIFGGSSYDGALSLSSDGQSIVVPGYNVPVGTLSSAVDSSGSSAVPRAVGLVHADGSFALGATTKQFSTSTIRSGLADGGGNIWAGGGASGIVYLGSNSPAATIAGSPSSTRELGLFNGTIYFTVGSPSMGIMSFTGAPVTAATPTLILDTSVTGAASPKGFAFNPAMTIAYVADIRSASSGGGIQRFNWSGSAWVYAYTIPNNLTSSAVVEDLAVNFSGANPVLYVVTGESSGNHVITTTDTGSGSVFTNLETAPSGDAFRGITFAP